MSVRLFLSENVNDCEANLLWKMHELVAISRIALLPRELANELYKFYCSPTAEEREAEKLKAMLEQQAALREDLEGRSQLRK